jgi:hypothetical protein
VDNFLRRPAGGKRFRRDILGGKIVYRHHPETRTSGYSPDSGVYLGRCAGQKFVQSIGFFFGHNCHELLLILISQVAERFPAQHGMENIDSLFIYQIIHNFENISTSVKAR